jgi:hypothetical protein
MHGRENVAVYLACASAARIDADPARRFIRPAIQQHRCASCESSDHALPEFVHSSRVAAFWNRYEMTLLIASQ